MKKGSTIPVTKKIHIKTIIICLLTHVRIAIIKKKKKQIRKPREITSVDEEVEKKQPFCTVGGNVN